MQQRLPKCQQHITWYSTSKLAFSCPEQICRPFRMLQRSWAEFGGRWGLTSTNRSSEGRSFIIRMRPSSRPTTSTYPASNRHRLVGRSWVHACAISVPSHVRPTLTDNLSTQTMYRPSSVKRTKLKSPSRLWSMRDFNAPLSKSNIWRFASTASAPSLEMSRMPPRATLPRLISWRPSWKSHSETVGADTDDVQRLISTRRCFTGSTSSWSASQAK